MIFRGMAAPIVGPPTARQQRCNSIPENEVYDPKQHSTSYWPLTSKSIVLTRRSIFYVCLLFGLVMSNVGMTRFLNPIPASDNQNFFSVAADHTLVNEKTSEPTQHTASLAGPLHPDPLPLQVWKRYTREHAIATLNSQSKFAVVPYWCPERAGNILHNLVNNVAWSVLHNRTILWDYVGQPKQGPNAERICESVLPRSRLFLSWSQAQSLWNLPPPILIDTQSPGDFASNQEHEVVYFPQIPDMEIVRDETTSFDNVSSPVTWSDHPLFAAKYKKYSDANLKEEISELYRLGPSYTHGMLLRHLFTWDRLLNSSTAVGVDDTHLGSTFPAAGKSSAGGISLALHSRHIVDADDGHWINYEIDCLEELLHKHMRYSEHQPTCTVFLMSDRPLTNELLSTWLQDQFGCQAVTVNHAVSQGQLTTRTVLEHGPNSGVGFLQDLQLASQARTALVGSKYRSSFMLLEELVAFDKITETVASHGGGSMNYTHIDFCALPQTKPEGYDYGPGTPTFIRPKFLTPLAPDAIVQAYLKEHAAHTWKSRDLQQRQFALIEYNCDGEDVGVWSHALANAWIFSIATNRTLVYRYTGDKNDDCRKYATRHSWLAEYNVITKYIPSNPVQLYFDDQGDAQSRGSPSVPWTTNIPLYQPVVVFPRITSNLQETDPKHLFADDMSSIKQLFSLGQDYLYGMLWNSMFRFSSGVLQNLPTIGANATVVQAKDSDDIEGFESCLSQLLGSVQRLSCEIVPVTSSALIEQQLLAWLSETYPECGVVALESSDYNSSDGPSLPWLRQVALASQATRIVESSPIEMDEIWLREVLEYHRLQRTWLEGQSPPVLKPLEHCEVQP